ncbi:MAG: ribosome maturation factor RimP [Microscillaceae bacterium]|nr:ribosome maturation factor RimP [Microscillaceae bacterium]MDW8459817.1 ribosome maturation factor RimP [Cytophagales bacterium]
MIELKEKISNLVNALLSDAHFLIEVQIKKGKKNTKIVVILDGDNGIDIDTCANISSQLSKILDEKDWIKESYVLEVSSPGADRPLQNIRQYKQHIGRKVKILTNTGQEIQGLFQAMDDKSLQVASLKQVNQTAKNKAQKVVFNVENPITIPLENIKTIQVLIG